MAACSFWTALIRVMRSKPENGIASTPWMPAAGSVSTGFWGTVRTMTGHAEPGLVELLDELQALDPALEQRVDEDDVGPELLDLGHDLRAVGHDVEQLDAALGVQQAADVLRDLRHVLDEEQAGLITGCHRAECTKLTGTSRPGPEVRVGPRGRTARQRRASHEDRRARCPGPSGSRS